LKPLFRAYFRMQGEGLAYLPSRGPYLLAPNHVSMLDWAFVSYFLPGLVRFVVDDSYYHTPLIGFGLRLNGAIPIRAGRPQSQAFRTAQTILARGEPLVMFPEGAISRTGRPQRAHPGVIHLAASTQTPIVPVAIRGAFDAFPRWQRLPSPGHVTVVFGRPLAPPPPPDRLTRRAYADGLMAHITALLDGGHAATPW
jgi:1-acyl-sn-glycerol-3-phosphate acyltransferase